jgi:hypothetical protein
MLRQSWIRVALSALTLLLTSISFIGCGSTTVKLGWSDSTLPGSWRADYATFEGVEQTTFLAQKGQTISLDYDVAVEKGLLTIKVVGPDGESQWEESFGDSAIGAVTLTVSQKGRYQVRVEGKGTGGSFDLSWNIEE